MGSQLCTLSSTRTTQNKNDAGAKVPEDGHKEITWWYEGHNHNPIPVIHYETPWYDGGLPKPNIKHPPGTGMALMGWAWRHPACGYGMPRLMTSLVSSHGSHEPLNISPHLRGAPHDYNKARNCGSLAQFSSYPKLSSLARPWIIGLRNGQMVT